MKPHSSPRARPDPAAYLVPGGDELLSVKELADQLKRTPRYIRAMVRDGFSMPGRRATLNNALRWLIQNQTFRQNKPKITKEKVAPSGGGW